MTDYTNVAARAMLVSLHISQWSAQRFDRLASDEVTTQNNAEQHHARVNKHLFGTRRASRSIAPEFAAVRDAGDALYNFHQAQTLPWAGMGRAGERLLATANYINYTDGIRRLGGKMVSAVKALVDAYPRLYADAMRRLGKLAREDDFIDTADLRRRFGYEIHFSPVPSIGDLRVDLPADQVAEIEQRITARVQAAAQQAMDEAWARLRASVERVYKAAGTRDDGKAGIVRDSLIENLRETCAVLGRLNVAQDERLDEMVARVERELTVLSVEDLRKDDRLRDDTARRAGEIIAAMSAFYTPVAEQEVA